MSEPDGGDQRRVPLSVVVLTLNEERNLDACLASVHGWVEDIFVVDSGSTDRTAAIAEGFGAHVVSHPFENHTAQWTWALETLPVRTSWVLGLDADQRVTPALRHEIATRLMAPADPESGPSGYYMRRRQVFRGRWIRHGGYYPKYLLKLFKREHVRLNAAELVDHHFQVTGPVESIHADLVEENKNEDAISIWTAKHNRYATLQAAEEVAALSRGTRPGFASVFKSHDERTRWFKHVWSHLPLFLRPCLYVFYRYVVRLGFLDGKQGFIFHVLQAFWYRLLVDINIDEVRQASRRVPDRS